MKDKNIYAWKYLEDGNIKCEALTAHLELSCSTEHILSNLGYSPLIGEPNSPIDMSLLKEFPSTNGVYIVPQIEGTKKHIFSTGEFFNKYLNDIHLDTSKADKDYFFAAKHISPKLFIKKLLIRLNK